MISWIGGKYRMANWINSFVPKETEIFIEVFGGMMWDFLKMDLSKFPKLKTVVYNDSNKLNSNLFECVKQYDKLHDELSKYSYQQLGESDTPKKHSEMFYKFQKEVFEPNLDIGDEPNFDIATKYVIVICQIFSGSKPDTSSFIDYKGKYRSKVLIFMDKLKNQKYRDHFDKITYVEGSDFEYIIKKYDSEKTYFYCDPPYYLTEKYYSNHNFGLVDHERLVNVLKNIKGQFSLSYYDFPQLSKWLPKDEYKWESKEYTKAAAAKKGKTQNKGTELLIMNY